MFFGPPPGVGDSEGAEATVTAGHTRLRGGDPFPVGGASHDQGHAFPSGLTRMDMHCHSWASDKPVMRAVAFTGCPECYSDPEAVHAVLSDQRHRIGAQFGEGRIERLLINREAPDTSPA